MNASPPASIALRNVVKRFGRNLVLDGLSLEVPAARRMALIGSAASGKTVLLKCILGLYPIEGGEIEIEGIKTDALRGAARDEMLNRFGVVFQRSALFDSLKVWQNIAFKRMTSGRAKAGDLRDAAIAKLRQVGMKPETADLFPASLSGGMQKRVALARALMDQPDILLLDDPTAGLDPILTRVINELIARLAEETGATVLAVTSDMVAMRRDYPAAAMLHDGRILWQGAVSDIGHAGNPYLDQLVNGRAAGPIQMRLRTYA